MQISQAKLLDMYRNMKLSRMTEQRLDFLYKQGRLPGAIYPGIGQEASYVGCTLALEEGDTITTTHRDLAALLSRGISLEQVMTQHFAKENSPTGGRGEDNYFGDLGKGIFAGVSMLPDMYPVAVGSALYFKRKHMANVAMPFCGEGATARGDFHESLNWAAVFNLPVVFIVVNNQYAYSTPNTIEIPTEKVADRAKGYDIEAYSVDGNDVLDVYKAAKKAVDEARNGKGPLLIEARTMRMKGHAGHDGAEYVSEELLAEWAQKDPIERFEKYLFESGDLSVEKKSQVETDISGSIDKAVDFAQQSSYPEPDTLSEGVFHD
ncbi:hypothetical protein LCGC14_0553170 [marine sediment metagenome]|uniref:Dehydrogenase E1 component domain-containing protein n=1 Tax=marine sediment metagenome TaxID=412755 RepID=A0A0F9S7X7_9ZZZZ|nr:thiamine pyrophosphate-dependent dehydrogenase E1 component subunit alpha [Actinomycetota bacterium]